MLYLLAFFAVIFTLEQAADIATTIRAIRSGRAHEGNPLAAWFMRRLGTAGGLVAIKVVIIAPVIAIIIFLPPRVATIVVAAMCAPYAWIIWHNWRLGSPK